MPGPNAIEQRLADLADRWIAFTDGSTAPALRWVVVQDSLPMAEGFVAFEMDETGTLPDLFLRFDQPFETATPYGATLTALLAAGMAESDPDGPRWAPPPARGDDVLSFAAACASLVDHYDGLFEHLVLVLTPAAVEDDGAFQNWLRLLVRATLPLSVRLLLIDPAVAPRYQTLADAEPERVVSDPVDLDMDAAYGELAAAGDPTDPGVQFRRHFVAMTGAIGKGDGPRARHNGDAALKIAVAQGWPTMEVAVHVALGSMTLDASAETALGHFRAGRAAAERAAALNDPAGPALVVQTRLAEASALFSAERYADAGVLYQTTAPLAAAREDTTLTLECWRMACYCFEQVGRGDYAWAAGLRAIQTAETIPADARPQTTLPYVGQGLLRLAEKPEYRSYDAVVRDKMTTLLGPDWQSLLEPAAPAS